MKVYELIEQLNGVDKYAEVHVVQQPNYPLVSELQDRDIEDRGSRVLIHLADADEYYDGGDDE